MAKKHAQALDVKFYCSDLDKTLTIRQYFYELLTTLWYEGEGFSGKRPFGNSGWQLDLQRPLVESGFVDGTVVVDEDGDVQDVYVDGDYHGFVQGMLKELSKTPKLN